MAKQKPFRFFVLRNKKGEFYSTLNGFQKEFNPITQCTRDPDRYVHWSKCMHGDKCNIFKCSHGYKVEEIKLDSINFVRYSGP